MSKHDRILTAPDASNAFSDWTAAELTELLRPARADIAAGRVFDFDEAFRMVRDATNDEEKPPSDEG